METGKQDSSLSYHIKRRITRKPNRVIKRSFIESAMCNHNIVMLLIGMLVVLGMTGLAIMPRWKSVWRNRWRTSSSDTRR